MKLKDKLKIIIKIPSFFIDRILYGLPKVMDFNDTLNYITNKNVSVCRFGDGEIDLINNVGIKFQKKNESLKNRLIEVAKSDNDAVLICIPDIFYSKSELENKLKDKTAGWWNTHKIIYGGLYGKLFRHLNGDARFTRFYIDSRNKEDLTLYIKNLRKIWENKNIVFVEGKTSKNGIGNDLFNNAKSTKRIICPSENAFDKYDEILKTVSSLVNKDDLVLCSLGPTASVLCYDLATQYSIRAIDIGHVDLEYEWYLKNADEKILIEGKDASETNQEYVETEIQEDDVIAVIE